MKFPAFSLSLLLLINSLSYGPAAGFVAIPSIAVNSEHRFAACSVNNKSSSLHSISKLVNEINESSDNKLVFVGGKGGVGKTSISSALAVTLASDALADKKVLVVSTDPAHSLGDAIDVPLNQKPGQTVVLNDPLTQGRLSAMEVDPIKAIDDFRDSLAAFDVDKLASSLGVDPTLLDSLGLREFSSLLNNPPPGLDELVALSNVIESTSDYDVVIVDTAPTGHNLRLLALPKFLDGFLGKLLELRARLAGLASTLQALFGSSEATQRAQTIDNAVASLEKFRTKIANMRQRLKNNNQTKFVVVTIPTKLAVSESKRLIDELATQNILVSDVVVNQCLGSLGESSSSSHEAIIKYYERRRNGQQKWVNELEKAAEEVSATNEYKSNGFSGPITVTKTPYFDVELVGAPALGYLGQTCYLNNPAFEHLMTTDDSDQKFIICGGKGGVGKTTTSSSLAVTMAQNGHNVALISTDPAHSLGDALDMDLRGGSLVNCPMIYGDGNLSVLEVDPSSALKQFKGVVDDLLGAKTQDGSISEGLGSTLREIGEIFDTLPAGTDEVVALAQVINIVKKGNFDRIVLDTAPTGHTLRLLTTPGFLADLIDRVLVIARKINSNSMVKSFLAGGVDPEKLESSAAAAKSTLQSFQISMFDLEDIFADASKTEFLIVTVPTELAARESIRLLNDLTFEDPDMPIKVRNIVANQVLNDEGDDVDVFLQRVKSGQSISLKDLTLKTESMNPKPEVTECPYLDTEPRGVFGLKVLSDELLKEKVPVN